MPFLSVAASGDDTACRDLPKRQQGKNLMSDPINIDFNGNLGTLTNAWNVNTSPSGQVTLTGSSAMMEPATGADAGHGYGTYDVVAKIDGSQPGPAIVFWPGNDQWPGQEIDLAENAQDGSGQQYGTLHWNAGGSNAFDYQVYNGVSGGAFHDYQMVWEPGKITMKVDGTTTATFTDHVPTDHDHGGINNTIGVMNTNSATSVTVDHVSYTPLGGTAAAASTATGHAASAATDVTAAVGASVDTSGVHTDHTDWTALAAQVQANFEATGHWFL
jgi:beta-glucanase (GH16 family)